MECENCGKDCEELFGKSQYNGNKDTRMMCLDCFEEVHQESFNDN